MRTWIWELSIGDRDEKFEERHEYMGWILSNALYSYMQFSNNKNIYKENCTLWVK